MTASQPTRSAQRQRRIVLIGVALMAALVALGIFSRLRTDVELRKRTEDAAVAAVATVQPHAGPASEELVLPGSVQAYAEAPIYARTDGYLKRYLVDIGARVKQGQLLAEIDTPEIDQQLRQAQADLAGAEANYVLAQSSAERWRGLLETESVSQQEADERSSDAAAKRALVAAARANMERLRELQSFQRVHAPFAGVVTARNTDVGALIGSGAGRELFRIAATQKLRVYIQAPQNYAPFIKNGLEAKLYFVERPQRSYAGKLVRSADAIDPGSGTLLAQIEVDNARGELLPGSYAQVHLQLSARDVLLVPVNTLIFRAEGLQVATVTAQNRVVLKPVVIGRDYGMEVEIVRGIDAGDQVILNPPDSIGQNQPVRRVAPAVAAAEKK